MGEWLNISTFLGIGWVFFQVYIIFWGLIGKTSGIMTKTEVGRNPRLGMSTAMRKLVIDKIDHFFYI